MERIVDLERKLFHIRLPANGTIDHTTFLEPQESTTRVPIEIAGTDKDRYSIGPSTGYMWWYGNRDKLAVNGGPCQSPGIILVCHKSLTKNRDATQRRDRVNR